MIRLQEDLLAIYNSLTDFSKNTLLAPNPLPIKVDYSDSLNSLTFEQQGLKMTVPVLNYYCLGLKDLHNTYLLPNDYDYLMDSLARVIESGALLHDRVCLAPDKHGFSIFDTKPIVANLKEGPQMLTRIKFVSGNSWLFKKMIHFVYERV